MTRSIISVIIASLLLWPVMAANSLAEEFVHVVFKDGKRVKGRLDPRTNETELWLRFGTEQIRVTRRIAWDDILTVAAGEQALSLDDVRQKARTLAPTNTNGTSSSIAGVARGPGVCVSPATPSVRAWPRLQSVHFDAFVANWDGDVETDGLVIQLRPLSVAWESTQVAGSLHVELWAMRRIEQDSAPRSGGRVAELVGRWTVAVRPEDNGAEQPLIQLPFQFPHPEFDTSWSPAGLVHLTLVVPGQGVFHHTEDGLRIRPFAPLRDFLERQTGERFLPTELTGRK